MDKILIVDDDSHIRELICFALEKANFAVFQARNGLQAIDVFRQTGADLIVLDINMAEMDGLECCREIRKHSDLPILFLSSRDEEIDRILGLEIGGDDYVTKPFSPRELVARIKVILKRTQAQNNVWVKQNQKNHVFYHGQLMLDTEKHQVYWQKNTVVLTAIEFAMMTHMIKQPLRVYSRDQIMTASYQNNVHVSDRTIDSHIRHIRQKFFDAGCQKIIETQHGVGYKLSLCQ